MKLEPSCIPNLLAGTARRGCQLIYATISQDVRLEPLVSLLFAGKRFIHMRSRNIKRILASVYFQPGAVRTIQFGPLRGTKFRVGPVTGMSPWYSGPERLHQQTFARHIKRGDIVVDVGANWGLHTLYLSRLVGSEG